MVTFNFNGRSMVYTTEHIIYYDGTFFPESFTDFSRLRFFPLVFSEQRRPVRLSTKLHFPKVAVTKVHKLRKTNTFPETWHACLISCACPIVG